jgi:two-component system OmpR family sensor kinase
VSRLRLLRWRLGLLYTAIAAAMLLALYAVAGASIESALVRSAGERLEISAGLVVADAAGERRVTATDLAAGDLAVVLGGYGTAVVIVGPGGEVLAAEANGAASDVVAARLRDAEYASVIGDGQTVHSVARAPDGRRVLIVAVPVQLRSGGPPFTPPGQGEGQGRGRGLGNQGKGPPVTTADPANAVAQLAISLDEVDATLAAFRAGLQLTGLALLALAAVVAWLVTRFGLRPLERVSRAAGRIAAGDLSARAALPSGGDEVGQLGQAFDEMADRVDATLRAQRAFAADASHELRSPLTVLGGYVDVLAASGDDPDARRRTLGAMRREIDRLSRLSADLLLLTQLEAGGGRLEPRPIDLGLLVDDIAAAARAIGPDREVVVARDGPLPVVADPDRITQAIMNLVDNAVRHTPTGGAIRITATRLNGAAVVEVANEGEPIPPPDLPWVFDRFYRASNGRSTARDGPHAGLGLAIVKAIAEASGGSVVAHSDSTSTRFSISLPVSGT